MYNTRRTDQVTSTTALIKSLEWDLLNKRRDREVCRLSIFTTLMKSPPTYPTSYRPRQRAPLRLEDTLGSTRHLTAILSRTREVSSLALPNCETAYHFKVFSFIHCSTLCMEHSNTILVLSYILCCTIYYCTIKVWREVIDKTNIQCC